MQNAIYLAACLVAALLAIAVLSWALARDKRSRDLRGLQAERLLQALQRYSDWVCAQRLLAVFQGETPEAAAALDEACTLRLAWFPELAGDMAQVMAVHNRLVHFLASQQALWLRDPEQWLASAHDERFMALWRQHRFALQGLQTHLAQATHSRIEPAAGDRQSTYA